MARPIRFFRIRNWSEFQHYSDRDPPWIKLYNRLLSEYEFLCLPDYAKWHLIGLWLLASRTKNRIPDDPEYLQGQLGSQHPVDLEVLSHWIEPVECGETQNANDDNDLHNTEHGASMSLDAGEKRRGEAEESSVSKKPPVGDVENSLEDGLRWNARLAPLARKAGGESKVGDWLRTAKPNPDHYEKVLIGLVSLRDRGQLDGLADPGDPMSPAILSVKREGQPIERRAEAEYWRLGRTPRADRSRREPERIQA